MTLIGAGWWVLGALLHFVFTTFSVVKHKREKGYSSFSVGDQISDREVVMSGDQFGGSWNGPGEKVGD